MVGQVRPLSVHTFSKKSQAGNRPRGVHVQPLNSICFGFVGLDGLQHRFQQLVESSCPGQSSGLQAFVVAEKTPKCRDVCLVASQGGLMALDSLDKSLGSIVAGGLFGFGGCCCF